ncbi:MAG: hypothetical protein JMM74_00825 [Candidatus Xiphinematobacter sp.]|nr:MAG: hypothetical protein JMM74_00825 [Candidatus Xiphinematobacter sp.]
MCEIRGDLFMGRYFQSKDRYYLKKRGSMPYQGGTIADWAALGLPFQSQGEKAIGVLGEQVGSLKIPDCQGTVVDTCFPLQWMTALHYTFFPITFVPSVETEEAGRLLLDYRREKVTSYEYRG